MRNFYSCPRDVESEPHASGRLSIDRIDPELFERRARFYMCGPDDMLRDFRQDLAARGVPDFEIFYERFTAPRRAPEGDLRPRKFVFKRQNQTVTWSPGDGSLLDLAEKNRLTVPAGCRTGQCESCAVQVVTGEFGYFTEVEDAPADRCLSCQAYPLSDITLDI